MYMKVIQDCVSRNANHRENDEDNVTITQHTFADTYYSGQRVPFPTDKLP